MLDVVAAHENEAPARIDAGVIDHRQSRLAPAHSAAAESGAAESAHRPGGHPDQAQHDEKGQEEADRERHFRAEQIEHDLLPLSSRLGQKPNG
jgi:hypothetical protein